MNIRNLCILTQVITLVYQFDARFVCATGSSTATSQTDQEWTEFRTLACARLEASEDRVKLGYKLSNSARRDPYTVLLTDGDWGRATAALGRIAKNARTKAIEMEIVNMVCSCFQRSVCY